MKKLSIMSAVSAAIALVCAVAVSCKTEVGPSGDPEFSVSLGNGPDFTYQEGKNVKLQLKSDAFDFYKDSLKIIALDNETTEEEDVSCSLSVNYTRSRWDIQVSGADTTAGKKCSYVLYVHFKENAKLDECVKILFTIKVEGNYVPVPKITVQPVQPEASYNEGDTAETLSVAAEIENGTCSYQWYKNGEKIEGATLSSYTPAETGTYYVVVSNKSDSSKSVKSDEVKIVFENPDAKTPAISSDLESQTVAKIEKAAALTVKATVEKGTIHAQWYKDTGKGAEKFGDEKTGDKTITTSVTPDSFGKYYVKLWNVNGAEQSGEITSKTAEIKESAIDMTITGISNEAVVGSSLSVKVSSEVPCDFTYQWYKTDAQSSADEKIDGETSASFKADEEGTYFCRVTAKSKATGASATKESALCYVKTTLSSTGSGNIGFDFN